MSNHKHLADLLKVCSILPALAIMPAMADDAILSGNAFVLGDVVTNETIYGGVRIVSATPQQLAYPKYNMVARSFDLEDINNGNKVLFGPVNLTVRELESDEAFRWNSQRYDEDGNPIDFDLASYNDDGTEREVKVVWNNANGVEELGAMDRFLVRDDTKEAGVLNITNSDVIIAGSTVNADKICFSGANVNLVKELPGDTLKASDGKVKISADELIVQDNSRILVGADTELDLTESEEILIQNNNAETSGGAISVSAGGVLNMGGASVVGNSSSNAGGAIYNASEMTIIDSVFSKNSVTTAGDGGAIRIDVVNRGKTVIADSNFSENKALGYDKADSGAISVRNGDVEISGTSFDKNEAMFGGAMYLYSGNDHYVSVDITDSEFIENTALGGGAIVNIASNQNNENGGLRLTDVKFSGNWTESDAGGALFLGAQSQTFIKRGLFSGNTSATAGGAISMRDVEEADNKDAKLDIIDSVFSANTATTYGGAIYSTFYDSESVRDSVYIKGTEFSKNIAERGGAIYTEGKADLGGGLASMKIEGAKFTENIAEEEGGAIQNRSSMNITNSTFTNNTANGSYGGALYNAKTGYIETLDADFEVNKVDSEWFAIGGAFANIGKIGEVTGMFESNKVDASAEDASSKGGAIYTYAGSSIDSIVADFVGNQAFSGGEAIGGAVVNDGTITKLHQTGQGFVNNVSDGDVDGWAGALYNSETGVISELVANFTGNSVNGAAWAVGGALVNKGTIESLTGTFANNTVTVSAEDGFAAGGAVYNEGTINFDGDVLFSNNTAVEGADIYNDGIVNIVSGTTTIDTTVAGEGTLNVASDAILNIGTATVQQTQINIDGIVQASVLSDRSYGRLLGLIEAKDSAELKLNVGSVGSYKIFDSQADITVTAGATYDVSQEADGTVVITTKAVEDIAADTGLTAQAAGAIAGLANATDKNLQKVSLAAQQVLNSGDVAAVERETRKLNPTDKPVAQATAASVQNQVLSLTSGRMAGGVSVGRAGGDAVSKENGFWMQGLFNKSKLADEFNGYTRGFALGADLLIDNKWTIGGGLAVNDSDVRSNTADIDIDSKTVFLYGQYKPNNWFVNATATYSMSEYTENKNPFGVMSGAAYDVESYGVQAMGGYDFAAGITAEAGLRYLHIAQDAYTDDLGFKVKATDTDFLSGVAGLKYAFAIENDWKVRLRPELRAAMTYDFISDDVVATVAMPGVASYKVDVERLSRMGGEFGIGLTALYRGMEVSLMYDLDLHKDYTSQTGMIKFRGRF
ncbi:MAG: autotransporter domain-containing protein [Alphaproteobacteria bacterium]|nr:autotransporter domain-containing protein [Alphaproteobacteria bacterium]